MPDIPMNRDVTYFARTNFRGGNQIFGIKRKDRRQHLYILGKSGTGKSALISNLVIQNIWNGEGLCLVDPHGELVETVLKVIPEHRLNDVVYFNPADTEYCIGFNPLELRDSKYKHLVASGLMGIFTKIWANVWSSRMEYIMNNTILALLDTPNTTLLGITRMLVDKDYRQVIINNLKDPMVKAFWVHEYEQWKEQFRNEAIAPIQNKVGQFLSSSIIRNIVGQQESTIDIFNLMNEGKIFLVNVSKGRIGEDNSALLGAMIITKLQLAAMERVRIPEEERRDFYLYVDEFQNFATESFASILSEARKYRLCLTLAHQYTAQIESKDGGDLKDAVFGNVGSMIIFRIGAEDAKILEKEFAPEFLPEDFIGLPNFEIYLKLMIDGITSRPFSANTLPPIVIKDGVDSTDEAIKRSREIYCRPQNVVEAAINSWSSTAGGTVIPNKQTSDGATNGAPLNKMYPAVCINCGKDIVVPFEPKAGKPIYCKECLNKIKVGELKPAKGFYDKNSNDGPKPAEALAAIGIEYQPTIINNNKVQERPDFKKSTYDNNKNNVKPTYQNNKKTNNVKPITNTSLNKIPPIKDESKDKEGFTTLKDLLTKINSPDKKEDSTFEIKNNPIKPDPEKVTIHPKVTEIKKTENPQIITPKAASYQSQQALKALVNDVAVKQPVTNTQPDVKNIDPEIKKEEDKTTTNITPVKSYIDVIKEEKPILAVYTKTEDKTQEKPINLPKEKEKEKDTSNEIPVPKPPESYSKRTPKKEVPEDVLKKLFETNNDDLLKQEDL